MNLVLIDTKKDLAQERGKKLSKESRSQYTMKIVLTMTVEAPDQDQAEVIAGHVAAFLPEDALRVANAFSPVIIVPEKSQNTAAKYPVAAASVILVNPGTPEATAEMAAAGSVRSTPSVSLQKSRLATARIGTHSPPSVRSLVQSAAKVRTGRRSLLCTRGAQGKVRV